MYDKTRYNEATERSSICGGDSNARGFTLSGYCSNLFQLSLLSSGTQKKEYPPLEAGTKHCGEDVAVDSGEHEIVNCKI
jgi:hypothetical protein